MKFAAALITLGAHAVKLAQEDASYWDDNTTDRVM